MRILLPSAVRHSITKRAGKLRKRHLWHLSFAEKMGKSSKSCANEKHGTWRSISPLMVNLRAKVGASNVLVKAFKQKDRKREKSHICTDCLKKCWSKREFTAKLPANYRNFPSYETVSGVSSNDNS